MGLCYFVPFFLREINCWRLVVIVFGEVQAGGAGGLAPFLFDLFYS